MSLPYHQLPATLRDGMQRYLEQRIRPGDFLTAVLANDLREAVRRADWLHRDLLPLVTEWIWNNVPPEACGTWSNVEAWIRDGAERSDVDEFLGMAGRSAARREAVKHGT